jgi:3-deoxy-7-phosphoheptulonate synthase
MSEWSPQSWRAYPAGQQPVFPDPGRVREVLERLATLPPLVAPGEVEHLRRLLADAAEGKRFLLQGGDCAERFADCHATAIMSKLKVLLQMSLVLTHGLRRPVVRVGRLGGQYAKPRSAATEVIEGALLPVYRGDLVNDFAPTPAARQPDPGRMLQAYFHAAATLNHVRALIEGGFADLHHPEHWNLGFIQASERQREYGEIVTRIQDAIRFMEVVGGNLETTLGRIDFFTSHEALVLPHEEALTRYSVFGVRCSERPEDPRPNTEHRTPNTDTPYNAGAHMLWLGDRTRALDGAHVEYLRGIANPIGVKVGPGCGPEEVVGLAARLNPENTPGRLTLITRLGAGRVRELLPLLIRAVQQAGASVLWCCDPMHGNTQLTAGGVKTRDFAQILAELTDTHAVHREQDSRLGGVHFELTGENVTECLGGARRLAETDLQARYATLCDPRLNEEQSLEMAFLLTRLMG